MFFLGSCSGEWTETDKENFMEACEGQKLSDCDCALKVTMEKYPKVADFNEKAADDTDLQKKILSECEGITIE